MYFCLDIGNSHIVAGVYIEHKLIHCWRINTVKTRTADEYFVTFNSLFNEHDIDRKDIMCIAISSVVPRLNTEFNRMFDRYFNCQIIFVNAYLELGLTYPIEDPGFIGADLVVNAFAAKEKYSKNTIVIDLGTATTIQLVDKNGHFYGTVIAPGVMTAASGLIDKASQLANIELIKPEKILGTNTRDALLSGIVTSNSLMIDQFIRKIKTNYVDLDDILVVATGGIAHLICSDSQEVDIIDSQLTLDGLMLICAKMHNKN